MRKWKNASTSQRRKTSFNLILAAILAMIFLGGCASAKFIETGPQSPAKEDDCPIEVFSSKTPDRDYEELGIIEGSGFLGGDTMSKVLPKMKQKACQAGGDAIILNESQKFMDRFDDQKLNVTATVIRWID